MSKNVKSVCKRIKNNGQVFTPDFIVKSILSYCNYDGKQILNKHIVDNSCGDGAFLVAIVKKYIETAREYALPDTRIKADLETYIHGIDNDSIAFNLCKENLISVAKEYGISNVDWDLHNTSALSFKKFDEKMDYVVGNPPYVRVHNLGNHYKEVKSYQFNNGGMADLYLSFFELGFNMLNHNGQLCYITPNSWLSSVAGKNMRDYIMHNKNLVAIVDLGHFQAFKNTTTYTNIVHFSKSHKDSRFNYYVYNSKTCERDLVENLSLKDIYIGSCFYLSKLKYLDIVREVKSKPSNKYVSVKNGFATLSDSVFIGENIPQSDITIRVVKASTGKWYKCLFPYNKDGSPLSIDQVFADLKVKEYLLANREKLLKGNAENPKWYLFGRSQALADVFRPKLAINSLIRTKSDFKLIDLQEGEGVYSGLYITTNFNISFDDIKAIIVSDDFIRYITALKKYKNGGYYTFNSKDLEQFINYSLTYKTKQKYVVKY